MTLRLAGLVMAIVGAVGAIWITFGPLSAFAVLSIFGLITVIVNDR